MGFTYFLKDKTDIKHELTHIIDQARRIGHTVKIIRCDGAGKNIRHVGDIVRELRLSVEYTSPYTPQMNGVVERRIAGLKLRSQEIGRAHV